jgi:hypothetical protein
MKLTLTAPAPKKMKLELSATACKRFGFSTAKKLIKQKLPGQL